jgi:hypothetical protein
MGQTVCVPTQREYAHQALVHDSSKVLRCCPSAHLDEALPRGHAVVLAVDLRIHGWCVGGGLCAQVDDICAVPIPALAGHEAPHDLSPRGHGLHTARRLADATTPTSAGVTSVRLNFPLDARTGITGEG